LLRYGGRFYMIHRADRLAEIVYELKSRHLEPKEIVNIIRKGDTADTVMISATKGGKSGVKVSIMDLRG
ncbi:MAG: SAM-dependent methyltransferase, partial [Clostridia bacterium]|nr:SAM-dependent methyltransferase [Clostridia bacterium]